MKRAYCGFVLAGLILTASSVLVAQPAAEAPASAEKPTRRSPLPDYFGRIGVSPEQRTQLDAIRADYDKRIADLEQQIEQLEAERDARLEEKLTPGQKLRLTELRAEAKAREAAEKEAAAAKGSAASSD
jgi:Spy/CpxP family protein refolding chaperone